MHIVNGWFVPYGMRLTELAIVLALLAGLIVGALTAVKALRPTYHDHQVNPPAGDMIAITRAAILAAQEADEGDLRDVGPPC